MADEKPSTAILVALIAAGAAVAGALISTLGGHNASPTRLSNERASASPLAPSVNSGVADKNGLNKPLDDHWAGLWDASGNFRLGRQTAVMELSAPEDDGSIHGKLFFRDIDPYPPDRRAFSYVVLMEPTSASENAKIKLTYEEGPDTNIEFNPNSTLKVQRGICSLMESGKATCDLPLLKGFESFSRRVMQ